MARRKTKTTKKRGKTVSIKTKEGRLVGFFKQAPRKFKFTFRKSGRLVAGKSTFKSKGSLVKKLKSMVK